MNEQRRLAYLETLSVDTYLPRRPLPGAAPGRCAPDRAPTPGPARAPRPPVAAREDASEGRPVSPAAAGPEPSIPTVPRNADSAAPGPAPCRFSLVAVLAGDWLWLEDLGDRPLASAQVQLIRAMADAVGFGRGRAAAARADVSTFDWPMHNNRQLDNGEEAARSSLSAFLQRRISESACRGIVLLGVECRRWVAAQDHTSKVVCTHSTAQMLERPELKRAVWRDLAALRAPAP